MRVYNIQGVLTVYNFYTSVVLRSLSTLFRHCGGFCVDLPIDLLETQGTDSGLSTHSDKKGTGTQNIGNAFMFFFGMNFVFLLHIGDIVMKNKELSRGHKICRNSIMIS